MRPGGGKQKGNAFERTMAKEISLWLTDGADATQLIRSVSSGGWAHGRRAKEGWRQAGDHAPNGAFGEAFLRAFGTECKDRREAVPCFWRAFTDADVNVFQWWRKITEECFEADPMRVPLLIFTAPHKPVLIGSPASVTLPHARMTIPAWNMRIALWSDWKRYESLTSLLSAIDADLDMHAATTALSVETWKTKSKSKS
jgi:hypothetical protein